MTALALAAVLANASTAGAAKPGVTCRYAESGPAGPAGNELRVKVLAEERGVSLGRSGSTIWVRAIRVEEDSDDGIFSSGAGAASVAAAARDGASAAKEERPSRPVTCSDGVPTVVNLDTVKITLNRNAYEAPVVINLRGGAPAPGATDEGDGSSEIELAVQQSGFSRLDEYGYGSSVVLVRGSGGDDSYSIGTALSGFAVNFNATEGSPDADLLAGPLPTYIYARGGDDTVTASGAPLEAFVPVGVVGGPGRDTVRATGGLVFALGGGGADTFIGGRGLSAALGGPGSDSLAGGAGRDYLLGGPGADEMRGGGGSDLIYSADGERDLVRCGRGHHDKAELDRKDKSKGCEHVERERD